MESRSQAPAPGGSVVDGREIKAGKVFVVGIFQSDVGFKFLQAVRLAKLQTRRRGITVSERPDPLVRPGLLA